MPSLEDTTNKEWLIIKMPIGEEHRVIEVPEPYHYEDYKAVPCSYELDVDLVTRSNRTYAQAYAQPARQVTDVEAKEFHA